MEDTQGGRCGPQLYLMSEDAYEDLKHIQAMLSLMASATCNVECAAEREATLKIGRAELYFIFQAINAQIGEVLERLGSENWLRTQNRTWQ